MSRKKEIRCIARLFGLASMRDEMVDYLIDQKIMLDADVREFRLCEDQASYLYDLLRSAEKEDKVQLLSFDWTVLPIERIRLRIVTSNDNKEFMYKF